MDLNLCNMDGDLASWGRSGCSCASCSRLLCFLLPRLEVMAIVPIMTFRRTKKTVDVNQLFMEAQIESTESTDCSNMALARARKSYREKDKREKI
jgi:hypothetical protein